MVMLADIHNHALFGLDDGAATREDCENMIAASYAEGVRHLCFTPHYHANYYTPDRATAEERFSVITAWAKERFPDLQLYLGNEVLGCAEGMLALQNGAACTLAGGKAVLFEFEEEERFAYIRDRLSEARTLGYLPVLAHAERYSCLYEDVSHVEELVRRRVQIQINAESLCRPHSFRVRRFVKGLLKRGLVALVASDAHDIKFRPPALRAAYWYVAKHFGDEAANLLFYENPCGLLSVGKEKEQL